MYPTPVFLPGESQRQRSLAGYSPWGCKESDMTERLNTHAKQIYGYQGVSADRDKLGDQN